jgi:hypothetical protein
VEVEAATEAAETATEAMARATRVMAGVTGGGTAETAEWRVRKRCEGGGSDILSWGKVQVVSWM